jgi:hypothetical protein
MTARPDWKPIWMRGACGQVQVPGKAASVMIRLYAA